MMARVLQRLPSRELDTAFVAVAASLLLLGLVMVASASVAIADNATGEPLYYFYRQLAYAAVGLSAAGVLCLIPMHHWRDNSFALLGFALFLLLVVLLPGIGREVNGARRWIDFGPVALQASEPARLALLLYLAGYGVRRQVELRTTFGGLVKPMLPVLLACLLLLMEPDYGAAAVLLAVTVAMLFAAGARLGHLAVFAAGAVALLAAAALSSPYRVARLVSFTDPWAHPYATGYQLTQSLIAIGRGEIAGVGLGNSVQKLHYLPETHTDFLFAVLAEELGLIGSVAVVALFGLLVWRGFKIAGRAMAREQLFNGYVAYALSFWIGLQAFVNIAVNMGLLPTKGLTLPLMSYGGSSLLTMCAAVGLLLRADMEARAPARSRSRRRHKR